MSKIFPGEGFEKEPLTPEEAARLRHMIHEVEAAWPYLKPMIDIARGIKSVVIALASLAGLAAAITWMIERGWFG